MICPACGEEFVAANESDDLCPECIALLRDGGQEVILGKYDTAIILRSEDGESFTKEVYIQRMDDENATVDAVSLATIRFALGMDDQQVIDRCEELFNECREIIEKVAEQAAAEVLLDEDLPKSHQLGQ